MLSSFNFLVTEVDSQNWVVHLYLSKVYSCLLCFDDVLISISNVENTRPKNVNEEINRDLENLKLMAMARSGSVDLCRQCLKYCSSVSSTWVRYYVFSFFFPTCSHSVVFL